MKNFVYGIFETGDDYYSCAQILEICTSENDAKKRVKFFEEKLKESNLIAEKNAEIWDKLVKLFPNINVYKYEQDPEYIEYTYQLSNYEAWDQKRIPISKKIDQIRSKYQNKYNEEIQNRIKEFENFVKENCFENPLYSNFLANTCFGSIQPKPDVPVYVLHNTYSYSEVPVYDPNY